jgi:hypothetical protein
MKGVCHLLETSIPSTGLLDYGPMLIQIHVYHKRFNFIVHRQFTIYNLLKLRTSYRLFTKVKSNKVMVSSRYKLELIIHYVVRSGQSSIMLSSCPLPTICY